MSALKAGAVIGILGGGQLGRMLGAAAQQLGFDVSIYCPEPDSPAARVSASSRVADYGDLAALKDWAAGCDRITFEFENVPVESVRRLGGQVWPGPLALEVSQDRLIEKDFLRACAIATADFAAVNRPEENEEE